LLANDGGELEFQLGDEVGGVESAGPGAPPLPCEVASRVLCRNHDGRPWVLDFRGSLYIAGMLHILHNLIENLLYRLESASFVVSSLKHICRILSRRWSRARFGESCCVGPLRIYSDEFQ
jgi:hypothetical protein